MKTGLEKKAHVPCAGAQDAGALHGVDFLRSVPQ